MVIDGLNATAIAESTQRHNNGRAFARREDATLVERVTEQHERYRGRCQLLPQEQIAQLVEAILISSAVCHHECKQPNAFCLTQRVVMREPPQRRRRRKECVFGSGRLTPKTKADTQTQQRQKTRVCIED